MEQCRNANIEKKYKCKECDKAFTCERYLNSHCIHIHGGFKCEYPDCGKIFPYKGKRNLHSLMHIGERKYVCDVESCGKAFIQPRHLALHKHRVHIATKDLICEVCAFRTKFKTALVVHKRLHTGERPFLCKICGKGFASQPLMKMHMPIHSNEKYVEYFGYYRKNN